MQQRHEWKFSYPADKLLAGARAKIDWHNSRIAVWQKAQDATKVLIKAEGIEIDDGVEIDTPSYSNRGHGPRAFIRNDLQEHLVETATKLKEHRTKLEQYEAWAQVLASQGQAHFELTHEDWMFFFGHLDKGEAKQTPAEVGLGAARPL